MTKYILQHSISKEYVQNWDFAYNPGFPKFDKSKENAKTFASEKRANQFIRTCMPIPLDKIELEIIKEVI